MITWTDDQVSLREGLARWGESLSEGHIGDDAAACFPKHKWELIRDTGLLRLPFGERWGGLGCDLLTTLYVLEGLGHVCRDSGLSFSAATSMVSTGMALADFADPALRDRYLPRIVEGDAIGAHAITEPGSGSDALSMHTRADRDGDHFVLHGSKTFCSNAPVADLFVIYAKTRPEGGPLGITAFLVERGTPGFEVGPPIGKMGLRTSPFGELFLDECRVGADQVIGRVGGGFALLDHIMKREILCSFAVNLGEMQHRMERCIDYATHRRQFGTPISGFQAVARKLIDMRIRVETSRKWIYDTAERLLAGDDVTIDIAISKLITSEANLATSLDAVQVFGGNGYTTEYGVEKDVRNAIAGTIYSGTTEIQYNRIASMLGFGAQR